MLAISLHFLGLDLLRDTSPMASLSLKHSLVLVVLLCMAATCCKSGARSLICLLSVCLSCLLIDLLNLIMIQFYTDPVDIVDKALECFHDDYVSSKNSNQI